MLSRRALAISALVFFGLAGAGLTGYLLVARKVRQALALGDGASAPLQFTHLPAAAFGGEHWGSGAVAAVAAGPGALLTAGGYGILEGTADLGAGLPTLKASALALWRGRPVAGLEAGGVFLRQDGHWEAFRTGYGTLHARVLAEGPGGDLLIGAREGLFRVAWGARSLERLDRAPVRTLARSEGGVWLAGGEQGLLRLDGARVTSLASPDPWIEWVGVQGRDLVVLTALGLARGPLGGELLPMGSGEEVSSAAQVGAQTFAVRGQSLLRFEASGRPAEEYPPLAPLRVFAAAGALFVDTAAGLYRRTPSGWVLAQARPTSLPPGPGHVTALAMLKDQLVVGLFDGGLAVGNTLGACAWSAVPGSRVWGVNALLSAGGVVYVASLRGAARFDGQRLTPLEGDGAGAAFALASTRDGVAIGYGQGVLLPGSRLLSAFHGLPGNQALALAAGDQLFVGTPSGLGAIAGARVAWRVTGGEGKLPNPWVTALALQGDDLFVGTYGGGVARRTAPARGGAFRSYPETEGLKVNPGCLVLAGDRLYLGTDGGGLYRLSADGLRFRPLRVALPSPRVTAILGRGEQLWIGTDEGLARIPLNHLEEGD